MESNFLDTLTEFDRIASPTSVLRDWIRQAVAIAETDPEMALTRARKVLEFVVRQVFEARVAEPPGKRNLLELLQRIVKDEHLPKRVAAYANAVRELGNVGTHSFTEPVTAVDVRQSLGQLLPVVAWYVTQDFAREPPRTVASSEGPRRQNEGVRMEAPAIERARVVPRGLRSFDRADSAFFLQLLPGPRDADDLPPSIRFWKDRIEATAELTFTVGLIYGPSGCGKSSLIKAGLIPRLREQVRAVYVEATPEDTEARLLKSLRQRCPELPADASLLSALVSLRTGAALGPGEKVVIVLDQFEQWLHAKRGEDTPELVAALRQCDGLRVQAIILVRDDFWLAVSRFLAQLDVRLIEGENTACADLFDTLHARKVLALFGRAHGRLPDDPSQMSAENEAFLDQAVFGLAEERKVISVRLALFAEMVKGKPWTPDTLREVGGIGGIGVTFLEETFSAARAPTEHRVHQQAARAVLEALLPEKGTDLKGHMRSSGALRELSGYAGRPRDFEDLLRILDTELRLVTPMDPEGLQSADRPTLKAGGQAETRGQYYQLTHDYLVPALREWLERKQNESRRGRAKSKLAQLEVVWRARQETQYLPKWKDWARIHWHTQRRAWTDSQRLMMRRATFYHVRVTCFWLMVVGLCAWAGVEGVGWMQARGLVRALEAAEAADVPKIIDELDSYHRWADGRLRQAEAESTEGSKEKLRARLALARVDVSLLDPLYRRLLAASPQEFMMIRQVLFPYRDRLVERVWQDVDNAGTPQQRFAAACVVASYDPDSPHWQGRLPAVAKQLIAVQPVDLGGWLEACRPMRAKLIDPLLVLYRQTQRDDERARIAGLLSDCERPEILADLVLDSDDKMFPVFLAKLQPHQAIAVQWSTQTLETPLRAQPRNAKEALGKRQANAAATLLRLGSPERTWRLLQHCEDPRARSYLIHRLGPLGVDPAIVVGRLDREADVSARCALLLALGEFNADQFAGVDRKRLLDGVAKLYHNDPDPGVHSAAEWLLRRMDDRIPILPAELRTGKAVGDRRWYVNRQGLTLATVRGPVEFPMGSPKDEEGHSQVLGDERLHRRRIDRSFAIATKKVTIAQYADFRADKDFFTRYLPDMDRDNRHLDKFAPSDQCPMHGRKWYEVAAYCNWLSLKDELPAAEWCYAPNKDGKFAEGMTLKPDYLRLTGYRMPTEAEWECACRAGAVTARYYGESTELLGKYEWYLLNADEKSHPVGLLKPNDLGLFDMIGNVLDWTGTRRASYPASGRDGNAVDDLPEPELTINDKQEFMIRGGSYANANARCANRIWRELQNRFSNVGFRPVRTIR
jgi:eukaryotic-like serine/threonine-protein kinase